MSQATVSFENAECFMSEVMRNETGTLPLRRHKRVTFSFFWYFPQSWSNFLALKARMVTYTISRRKQENTHTHACIFMETKRRPWAAQKQSYKCNDRKAMCSTLIQKGPFYWIVIWLCLQIYSQKAFNFGAISLFIDRYPATDIHLWNYGLMCFKWDTAPLF